MKKLFILSLVTLTSSLALAVTTTTYTIDGMTCSSCVKIISSKICKLPGVEKCDVKVGSATLTFKDGTQYTQEQMQTEVSKAGKYTITGSK